MNKIKEIRDVVHAFLESLHPTVYYEIAGDDAEFPYLIYELPNSFTADESTETFVLEVDGWDLPETGDTTALENLMSVVDGDGDRASPSGLHRKSVVVLNALSMTFYREKRIPLFDDEDKRIRRRKYVYQIRTNSNS